MRGLRSFVGFRQVPLEYDRPPRGAGAPKYTFGKLMGLAADGLVSFSGRPLRLVTGLGLMTALASVGLIGWVVADAWYHHSAPRGWASILGAVLFIGAVQMISLGLIGEYVRLIFLEAKERPSYVVARHAPARSGRHASRHRRGKVQRAVDTSGNP